MVLAVLHFEFAIFNVHCPTFLLNRQCPILYVCICRFQLPNFDKSESQRDFLTTRSTKESRGILGLKTPNVPQVPPSSEKNDHFSTFFTRIETQVISKPKTNWVAACSGCSVSWLASWVSGYGKLKTLTGFDFQHIQTHTSERFQ